MPSLHRYLLSISLLLLLLAMSSVAVADMNSLRQLMSRLDKGGAAARFPKEYGSFRASMTAAVSLVAAADETAAGQLLALATMKGAVLEGKLADPYLQEQSALPTSERLREQLRTPPLPLATPFVNITSQQQLEPPFSLARTAEPGPPAGLRPKIRTIIPGADALRGGEQIYLVKKGDSLRVVAARLGVSWRLLAGKNGLKLPQPLLKAGMKLKYNDCKIVPKNIGNGLLINIPDRTLYLFKGGKVLRTAAVTVGKPRPGLTDEAEAPAEQVNWQTPTGTFTITAKSKDPVWRVPASIQNEMRQQGKEVLVTVPPGRKNPLGRFALKTTMNGILLHSTNMPASIYGFNSHGCIRVSPQDMAAIFKDVAVNTGGEIIYMPVKVAVTEDGRVFIEVHRDVYGKTKDLHKELLRLVNKYDIGDQLDWQKVEQLLKRQSGVAEDVTRKL